jgi:Fe-S cluster biogenesis protein NfuA
MFACRRGAIELATTAKALSRGNTCRTLSTGLPAVTIDSTPNPRSLRFAVDMAGPPHVPKTSTRDALQQGSEMPPLCGLRGSRWVTRRDVTGVESNNESSFSPTSGKSDNRAKASGAALRIGKLVLDVSPAVESVLVGPDFVSVNVSDQDDWDDEALSESVLCAVQRAVEFEFQTAQNSSKLEDQLQQHQDGEVTDEQTQVDNNNAAVVEQIKEIIDERVRPNLQADGGDVEFVGFDAGSGVVQLRLIGACSTCPSSTGTMHFAIRNLLTFLVDEVTDVVQVWDDDDDDDDDGAVADADGRAGGNSSGWVG